MMFDTFSLFVFLGINTVVADVNILPIDKLIPLIHQSHKMWKKELID